MIRFVGTFRALTSAFADSPASIEPLTQHLPRMHRSHSAAHTHPNLLFSDSPRPPHRTVRRSPSGADILPLARVGLLRVGLPSRHPSLVWAGSMPYTEAGFTPYTIVRLTCPTFSRHPSTGAFSSLPPPHGNAPVPCGSGPLSPYPAGASGSGSFWPDTPLHPLINPALNGHFSLFAIWPYFFSFRPYFRSCFGPRLCKCTNLGRHSIFAILYVIVLCILRNSSLVKVCAFAQTLTSLL